jgi:hypothetical protein
MLQDKRQDLDHLPVAAGLPEQVLLQPLEGIGQFSEGRAVAQGAGLALDDRQIVPPVIDGLAGRSCERSMMRRMLADGCPSAATTIRSG